MQFPRKTITAVDSEMPILIINFWMFFPTAFHTWYLVKTVPHHMKSQAVVLRETSAIEVKMGQVHPFHNSTDLSGCHMSHAFGPLCFAAAG